MTGIPDFGAIVLDEETAFASALGSTKLLPNALTIPGMLHIVSNLLVDVHHTGVDEGSCARRALSRSGAAMPQATTRLIYSDMRENW